MSNSSSKEDWWFLLALIAILGVIVWGLSACYTNIRNDFEAHCLAEHPNAHVAGRTARTLYCLGPNGEVWDTR